MRPHMAKVIRNFSSVRTDLHKELEEKGSESERAIYPRKGVLVSCLRPFEIKETSDYLKFDKYFSRGEMQEQKELSRIKQTIDSKLTKDNKKFEFTRH